MSIYPKCVCVAANARALNHGQVEGECMMGGADLRGRDTRAHDISFDIRHKHKCVIDLSDDKHTKHSRARFAHTSNHRHTK